MGPKNAGATLERNSFAFSFRFNHTTFHPYLPLSSPSFLSWPLLEGCRIHQIPLSRRNHDRSRVDKRQVHISRGVFGSISHIVIGRRCFSIISQVSNRREEASSRRSARIPLPEKYASLRIGTYPGEGHSIPPTNDMLNQGVLWKNEGSDQRNGILSPLSTTGSHRRKTNGRLAYRITIYFPYE